jgi:ectoine hydroxylase-related dioxygenase (phytanoyl-CoA dioxygenase family)
MKINFRSQVMEEGFAILPSVFSAEHVERLLAIVEHSSLSNSLRRRGGTRNLLETIPSIRDLAASDILRALVEPILGSGGLPVRAILFDKVPEANWKVPWHQDLSIAVHEKIEVAGFGPWSTKAGVIHVQPPAEILEKMLAVRIHLDECDHTNGPVRVIPGSHRYGRIPETNVAEHSSGVYVNCLVPAGGVLLMKPLLLHASSPSQSPKHRRVIHIEYAAAALPDGLRWHFA